MNCGNLLYETYQLNSYLNTYLKVVIDGPNKISKLLDKIEELVEKLEGKTMINSTYLNKIHKKNMIESINSLKNHFSIFKK